MTFHPDVLAVHAQFGGDLESMQALYDRPDHLATIERLSAELARAREVLAPLSEALDDQGNPDPIDFPDAILLHNGVSITFGDCRAARQFIEKEFQL